MSKLWQSSSTGKLHPLIESYTVGDDPVLDLQLLPYDVQASKVHAAELGRIGILSEEEVESLHGALDDFSTLLKEGKIEIKIEDEDGHTVLEKYLTEQCSDAGKKIHSGRSRNDQVLVALRLYMKDHVAQIRSAALDLAAAFLDKAKQHETTPFPGYSHTQQAMMSSLGHYYASFIDGLLDDVRFLDAILDQLDSNPLGAAAGFGSSFAIDREKTTEGLGFSRVQINSLAAMQSRGKLESLVLEGCVQVMLTLSRFATDMIFFTSQECDFFRVADSIVTGSSIMPQKRNLDGLEVLRAHVGTVCGYQKMTQDICKGLMSGYHRDLSMVKGQMIKSLEIVHQSIGVTQLYVEGSEPNETSINAAITVDIAQADAANALVQEEGIPFRDAYVKVKNGEGILPNPEEQIASKKTIGSPGNLCLDSYESAIVKAQK